ncbi:helix-turn-helix protein [Kribbella sp. VKM Ac-2527]|uniref:Helix-turn-helix protein n=2 Tax=Kribbella caucasensis TaxID=2512215 RepID=A0A4R6KD50_9ACTN|nr:helix-turn-helix protein [Kribbella sp. VKM Ac-2527]
MTYTAGRRVDQDPLPGADLGRFDQRLIGGERGQRQGAGLDVVDTGGLVGEDTGRSGHVLGVRAHPAGIGQHPEDLVAGLERVTPMPTASTTPETSQPRTSGIPAMVVAWARFFQSVGLTPAAWTATRISLTPDVLFVDDGDVLTSAGAASGIDVCLHLVRKDHGSEVANHVARMCVAPPWRDGGQAQYIEYPVPDPTAHGTSAARQWALEHLHKPLALTDLAEQSHMSLRTFARRFNDEVGMSPGRWLIQQRVGRARHLLESTDLAVDEIASQVGFAGGTSLREHLHAAIGVSPLAYRRTFRGALAQNH